MLENCYDTDVRIISGKSAAPLTCQAVEIGDNIDWGSRHQRYTDNGIGWVSEIMPQPLRRHINAWGTCCSNVKLSSVSRPPRKPCRCQHGGIITLRPFR